MNKVAIYPGTFDPITFGTILGVSSFIKVVHIAYDKHIRTQKGGQNHGVAGMWLPLIFRVVWVVYSSMYEPNMDKKNDLQSKDEIQLVLGAVLAWTILLLLLILIPTRASLISIPILFVVFFVILWCCLLYTSPSPRDMRRSRMPSSA